MVAARCAARRHDDRAVRRGRDRALELRDIVADRQRAPRFDPLRAQQRRKRHAVGVEDRGGPLDARRHEQFVPGRQQRDRGLPRDIQRRDPIASERPDDLGRHPRSRRQHARTGGRILAATPHVSPRQQRAFEKERPLLDPRFLMRQNIIAPGRDRRAGADPARGARRVRGRADARADRSRDRQMRWLFGRGTHRIGRGEREAVHRGGIEAWIVARRDPFARRHAVQRIEQADRLDAERCRLFADDGERGVETRPLGAWCVAHSGRSASRARSATRLTLGRSRPASIATAPTRDAQR